NGSRTHQCRQRGVSCQNSFGWSHYQDEIEGLRYDKQRLKCQLDDARTHNRLLQSRVDSSTFDPRKRMDFLHGLLEFFRRGEDPPENLNRDTIVSITVMDQRKAPVPKYPSAREPAEQDGSLPESAPPTPPSSRGPCGLSGIPA
ncbi:hypothetical protein JG688_00000002, partial [Phytophthora aleatoria]